MTDIRARIRVDPDHRISGTAPAAVPRGEHEVTITITRPQPAESDPASPACRSTLSLGTAASRSDAGTCMATMAADPILAIDRTEDGRAVVIVFTLRVRDAERLIRPDQRPLHAPGRDRPL
jgi:hypothetical protein